MQDYIILKCRFQKIGANSRRQDASRNAGRRIAEISGARRPEITAALKFLCNGGVFLYKLAILV
jgi:hypothetical protein